MSLTRTYLNQVENVNKNRELFLSMIKEDKRKFYKCKNEFLTVDKLEKWPEYFVKNDLKHIEFENPCKVDGKLNEKISIFEGDITILEIDAIVNAANNSLLGGGGVDGAIHRAAGKLLLEECETLNGCQTGDAKITAGYNLPAKYVIHTVGPIGEKPDLLKKSYNKCLDLARENNFRTIAFPCISTGVYGYPHESAADTVLNEVRKYLEEHHESFDLIIFCLFMENSKKCYKNYLCKYFPIFENKQLEKNSVENVDQKDEKREFEEQKSNAKNDNKIES
ncbi:unnamed protein product [Brachionus calyciflorus]|uniref:Macro domain-containing protein n=1 Tax=Brachionus calyciflorus TaxID=104777 RepID=A0A814MSL6_9BILA|nr:unnamed protein product [Brachionus calyciflorus]